VVIPDPEVGLVIHFNYLWRREWERGRDNARYARPCAIVVAHRRRPDGAVVVVTVPITHSPPSGGTEALELPRAVKQSLELDAARSWVVVDEVNEFVWPGYDLEPNAKGEIAYGIIPPRLHDRIRRAVLECARTGGLGRVSR
jgi:hypothetical protein